jgi:hypothetical protein
MVDFLMLAPYVRRRGIFLLPILIGFVSSSSDSRANERSGDLQTQLQRQVSVTWQGQSLAGALAGLSNRGHPCVWLDRRVDPEQSIELSLREVSLKRAFEKLARNCNLHVAYLGGVVYLGPDDAAGEIMALREKFHDVLENSPRAPRQSWYRKSAWAWSRLSEPRDLLQELFSGTPIKLQGIERVPYDLWDARQLPRLTRMDRAMLLLIGFNLTLHIDPDGKHCQVVPIERPVVFTRQYPIRTNQGSQGPVRPVPRGRRVYSLEIREQTLRSVLRQLASQLSVELTWDERQLATTGHSLDTRISCKVQSASLEQLLEAILTPAGLHHQRVGGQIRIQAKP